MTRALDLYRRRGGPVEQRYSFSDWAEDYVTLSYGGNTYGPWRLPQSMPGTRESIANDFEGYVNGAYQANGVVFACVLARLMLFSGARFLWQRLRDGVPGDLFGSQALRLLERPAPNKTTREILARVEQDVSLAGNWYGTVAGGQLRRLRPDWVTIVVGSFEETYGDVVDEVEWDVLGYIYQPGGKRGDSKRAHLLLPRQVAHFSPIPDPLYPNRGMSWLTPAVRNVEGHNAATQHKIQFFNNGATPNMVVSFAPEVNKETFEAFKESMDSKHSGAMNAYKTLYLMGGADVTVVGNSFEQMSFKATQGQDETLICAAAGVPPIIVGVSEGLSSATYSNYAQARRKFGDHWARPQWGGISASLEALFPPPGQDVRLWYDDRNIAFLREDRTDEVKIHKEMALTIESLIRAGFTSQTAVAAAVSGDFNRLVHTGLFSVQLQKPGALPVLSGGSSDEGDDEDEPADEPVPANA